MLTIFAVIAGMICAAILAFLLNPRIAAILTEIVTYFMPAVLVIQFSGLKSTGIYSASIFRDFRFVILLPILGAAYGVAVSVFAVAAHAIYPIPVSLAEAMFKLLSTSSIPEFLWVVLVAAVTPAIAEEILFRGILQPAMVARLGARWGIILTSIIFALIHFNPWAFFALLIEGTFFGYVAYRTKTFWAGALAHFGINCMAVISATMQPEFDYADMTEGTPWYVFIIGLVVAVAGTRAFMAMAAARTDGSGSESNSADAVENPDP